MTFWVQDRDGKVYKGKSSNGKYIPGMIPFGTKLFNPYTKKTVIGWNRYKKELVSSQREKGTQFWVHFTDK